MSFYTLQFDPRALKEWRGLDRTIQIQFKKVLARRLEAPRVEVARLSGTLSDCYKIKLRAYEQAGKRL